MALKLYLNNNLVPVPDSTSVAVTKSLIDIYSIEKRATDYTKNIILYGTPEVNKALSQVWHFDHTVRGSAQFDPDFNPNLKATASLYDGDVLIISGFMKLDKIRQINRDEVEYDITLHGEQADLFVKLGETKLSELDFTDLNHTLSQTNIVNSWATSYTRSGSDVSFDRKGYVYALYHDGSNVRPDKRKITDFRPSLFFKEIVDKIFSFAGKTYSTGSIFEDTNFKKWIKYPSKSSFVLTEAQMIDREFEATHDSPQSIGLTDTLLFNDDSTGDNFDTGGNYDTTVSTYVAPVGGYYLFAVGGTFNYSCASINSGTQGEAYFSLRVDGIPVTSQKLIMTSSSGSVTDELVFGTIRLKSGQAVTVQLDNFKIVTLSTMNSIFLTNSGFTLTKNASVYFYNECQQTQLLNGDEIDFTSFFNNDMTCKEFLFNIGKEFNLIWQPNPDKSNELIVKPLYSYYTSTVENLSTKLDFSLGIESEPMGELDGSKYIFTNAKGEDEESKDYFASYGESFGTYRYKVNNDLVAQSKEIKSGFVKPMLYKLAGVDCLCSNLETTSASTSGFNIGFYNGLLACKSFQMLSDTGSTILTNYTSYPYSGHLDNPKDPDNDILFGMPKDVVMADGGRIEYTNSNQFNNYWRQYITEITDKDSRVVAAHFNIRPLDFYNLTFDKLYFFNGQYFRLLKIEDYTPTDKGELTKLVFLKSKTAPAFTPEKKRINRGNDTDAAGDKMPTFKGRAITNGSVRAGGGTSGGVKTGVDGSTGEGTKQLLNSDYSNLGETQRTIVTGRGGVSITPGVNDVIALNCSNTEISSEGVYIANQKWDLSGSTNGQVPVYDSTTNSWLPGSAAPTNSRDVLIDCGTFDETGRLQQVMIDCGTF